MKKTKTRTIIFSLPLFLICLSISLKAQKGFGLKAGLNMSTIRSEFKVSFTSRVDYNYKYSYHGGVYFDVPLSATIGIRPEVLFSAQ